MAKRTPRLRGIEAAEATAATVRRMMGEQGASINGLAAATGIPFSTLRRKLAAPEQFTMADLLVIAEALGVAPSALLPREFTAEVVA